MALLRSLRYGCNNWCIQPLQVQTLISRLFCAESVSVAGAHTLDELPTNSSLIKHKPLTYFRTSITNPSDHTWANISQFYTIHPNEANRVFCLGGIPKLLVSEMEAFKEVSLMIRRPALEIISYLKAANYDMPAIRYVIYGRRGTGKTLTLAHLIHYCAANNWFIIHLPQPNVLFWRNKWQERPTNIRDPQMIDYPTEGARLLNAIRRTNKHLLEQYQLSSSKEYVWSKREVTEVGTPVLDMIEFGVNRTKYSCDVLGAVIREIRIQAKEKQYKTLVAIDGVNGLFGKTRKKIKRPDLSLVPIDDVTIIRQYKRQLLNDWSGGAIITTVQQKHAVEMDLGSHHPKLLLTQKGFELFDPFVPVEVCEYNDDEIESQIDYYIDRAWITTPDVHSTEARDQIKHLSGYNPQSLQQLVKHL